MKQLVSKKKLDMWNNIVEKANQDFEGNKYIAVLVFSWSKN